MVMSFSFSVQSLMNSSRLSVVLMLRVRFWMSPHQRGGFWFSFGNFIFSFRHQRSCLSRFMMYRLLCANSRQWKKMSRMELGVVRVRDLLNVSLVASHYTEERLGSSYPQYPSRVVLVICNASNGVSLVGFGV
jgi:hypothetical protein